uniref:thiamine pyrophosphate-dependent enzyme n=1 Tax=uncultured Reyranella sp. TaxID=735512 RepID=UPI00259D1B28
MTATDLAEPVATTQEPHLQREPLQLLGPDGTYAPSSGLTHGLEDGELQELYARMVVTRRVDREIINLQRQGQVGVYPSCLGQEGAQVGAAAALGSRDWVFPQYRELGFALQLGVTPTALAHLWRGTWHLGYDPFEHRYAPISIPIGTQALHAVGYAMGAKLDGVELATVACFGDGATSTGDVHEALNFAGVYQAPVVFFVQNNRYAISVPLAQQTAAPTLAHKAIGYGIPALRCDGNDVLASYVTTKR